MKNVLVITELLAIFALSCQLALFLEWVMLRGIFRKMLAGLRNGATAAKSESKRG